ncbi:MAG: hypothetical protein QF632_03625 [Candidatus Woesearchaeota archaeon]|jgi:hypothetical protein|nr:hypothetical protein [Candidatus Woesearchaeota archaeon]
MTRRKNKDGTLQKRVVGCLLQSPWDEGSYDSSNIDDTFYFSEEHRHLLMTRGDGEYKYHDPEMRKARWNNPFFSAHYCWAAKAVLERAIDEFQGDIRQGLTSVIATPSSLIDISELGIEARNGEFEFYTALGEALSMSEEVDSGIADYLGQAGFEGELLEALIAVNKYDKRIIGALAELTPEQLMGYATEHYKPEPPSTPEPPPTANL